MTNSVENARAWLKEYVIVPNNQFEKIAQILAEYAASITPTSPVTNRHDAITSLIDKYIISDEHTEASTNRLIDSISGLLLTPPSPVTDERKLLTLHEAKLIESFADGFVADGSDDGDYWGEKLMPIYRTAFEKGKQYWLDSADSLRSRIGAGVKVKELEWEEMTDNLDWRSRPLGDIDLVYWIQFLGASYYFNHKPYNTIDLAKQAAQADFAERIVKALESTTTTKH